MTTAWTNVPIGTIVDEDIILLARSNNLIVEEFDERFVKQACYELRASTVFYDLQSAAGNKRVVVNAADGYLLKPHCHAVSIILERIDLPPNVLARIMTKGQLFSIGLLPVNTYADPGFKGRLGITLYNLSERYIVIKPGEAIAKIEFTILPKPVERPYSGQHGYESQIWPVAEHLCALPSDDSVKRRLGSLDHELELSHGPRIAEMARQLRYYRYEVWVQLTVGALGFGVIFAHLGQLSLAGSVGIGIASNLLTALLIKFASDKIR